MRVLVGFIGAYFVFKNISQLLQYQRALRGNLRLARLPPTPAAGAPAAALPAPSAATLVSAAPQSIGGPRRTSVGVVGVAMGQVRDPLAHKFFDPGQFFDQFFDPNIYYI